MYASLYIEDRRVQLFNINDVDNANLADFTILCQAGKVKAHKVVLSTRCNYFRIMIDEDHRVEQADFPGISHEVMKQVLRLIYGEEVLVADKHFTRFIKLCQLLQVKYQVRFEIDQARKLTVMKPIRGDGDSTEPPTDEEFSYGSYSGDNIPSVSTRL